jgi:hypothetical protein
VGLFCFLFSLLLFVTAPSFLQWFARSYLEKKGFRIGSVEVSHRLVFTFQELRWNRSRYHLVIDSLQIVPDWQKSLLTGKPTVAYLYIHRFAFYLMGQGPDAFEQGLESEDEDSTQVHSLFPVVKKWYRNTRTLLLHLPENVLIESGSFYFDTLEMAVLSEFRQRQNAYSALLRIRGDSIHLQGTLYPDSHKIAFSLIPLHSTLKWESRNAKFSFQFSEVSGSLSMDTVLTLSSQWRNVGVFHNRIAEEPVILDTLVTLLRIKVSDSSLVLYPGSMLQFNRWHVYPQMHFMQHRDTILSCSVVTDTIPAQVGFESIPVAFRKQLGTMRFEGKWAFSIHFYVHLGTKDSAFISVKPYLDRFQIVSYGKVPLPMLNDTFTFKPYGATRFIHIGPRNPHFTPLNQISPYLIHSVRISEDGSFFRHRGFNVQAIQESLIENLRRGYFARGGSTISMQLIKNVFLTHRKTLARKFQELLLTWLMEGFQVVPKERIMEVYLNIIEWGPDVYGIGEASEFYFKREPSTLTPSESIFLAMIISSPRKFYYFFNRDNDSLKQSVEYHYRLVGYFLKRDSVITEEQYQKLFPPYVSVIGPAREYLPPVKAYFEDQKQTDGF